MYLTHNLQPVHVMLALAWGHKIPALALVLNAAALAL